MIVSAADQVTYPRFARYVRRSLPGIANMASMRRAFRRYAQMDRAILQRALRWGNQPTLSIVPITSAPATFVNGQFTSNTGSNTIKTALIAIVISALLPGAVATAGQFYDRTFQAKSYPHSEDRRYTVYVPDSYDGSTPVPLVVVLHGCKQTQRLAFDEQGWHRSADRYGFILLAPFVTSHEGLRNRNCWGWWSNFDYEIHEGGGEIEDIYRIAIEVESQYSVDSNRRHIIGLSAGGFMANVAAVTHNEYWASAAVIEGGGYGETVNAYSAICPYFAPRRTAGTWKTPQQLLSAMQAEFDDDYKIPMLLMHSTNDCTVGFGVEGSKWGGLTANREAWLQHNGGIEYHSESCAGNGVSECTYKKFGRGDGRSTVETLAYVGATNTPDGKGHYFPGGVANGEWTRTDGPDTRNIVWAFFSKHGRSVNTVPEVSLNGSNPMRVKLAGERLLVAPEGAAAAADQRSVVFAPVPDTVLEHEVGFVHRASLPAMDRSLGRTDATTPR